MKTNGIIESEREILSVLFNQERAAKEIVIATNVGWGQIYPLLHSLERRGLVESRQASSTRRYYKITEAGKGVVVYAQAILKSIETLLLTTEDDYGFSNSIYLELEVYQQLKLYVEERLKEADAKRRNGGDHGKDEGPS